MYRAYRTRNTDRVRVTGTPSPGSVAPASFINTVDGVNPSIWSHFPVRTISEYAVRCIGSFSHICAIGFCQSLLWERCE